MIAYFKCLCTAHSRLMANRLQGLGYEIREIRKNRDWRNEALAYKAKLPFTVNNGEVTEL